MSSDFYDVSRLLSKKDINGDTPEWFLVSGNKTAGKTTSIMKLLVNRFLKHKEEFMLVYRWTYELKSAGEMIEATINPLFWPNIRFKTSPVSKGLFYKIFCGFERLDENEEPAIEKWEVCGYSVALNNVDTLKKYSNFFQFVVNKYLDEFQAENDHYTKDEIKKWETLQILSSRGQGQHYRYTRTILSSNSYSLLNPYFLKFGIHKRIQKGTKFIRGDGWVFEQCWNEKASSAIKQSALINSLGTKDSVSYATENKYLDNDCFVTKMSGKSEYIMTIIKNGKQYGIREFGDIWYVSDKAQTCSNYFSFSTNDHGECTKFLAHNSFVYMSLNHMFRMGNMRFKSIEEKDVILDVLSL